MTKPEFDKLVAGVAALNGIPIAEAAEYVTLVGDHPEFTDETWVVVRDRQGEVLTTLQWLVE